MFTGIIETVAEIVTARPGSAVAGASTGAMRLELRLGRMLDEIRDGASVAVNGVCLTLAGRRGEIACFDVVPETWQRSNLRLLRPGDAVNIERALRMGDRLDGHFVQGHVDAIGRLDSIDRAGAEWKLWVALAAEPLTYIAAKGSVAIDGISLTVVDVESERFSVAIIPTTLRETNLSRRAPGDQLNIETDYLARLVIGRLMAPRATGGGLTLDKLRDAGFAT